MPLSGIDIIGNTKPMQRKNSFDPETVRKIKSSFKWALSPAVCAAIINLATSVPTTTWWGVAIIYVVPIIINAAKEWANGE
jgi:hypothetical protein